MTFQETRFPTTTTPMFHLNRSQVKRRPDIPVCDAGRLYIPGQPSVDVVYLSAWQKQNHLTNNPMDQDDDEPQQTEADKMAKFKAQGEEADKE